MSVTSTLHSSTEPDFDSFRYNITAHRPGYRNRFSQNLMILYIRVLASLSRYYYGLEGEHHKHSYSFYRQALLLTNQDLKTHKINDKKDIGLPSFYLLYYCLYYHI